MANPFVFIENGEEGRIGLGQTHAIPRFDMHDCNLTELGMLEGAKRIESQPFEEGNELRIAIDEALLDTLPKTDAIGSPRQAESCARRSAPDCGVCDQAGNDHRMSGQALRRKTIELFESIEGAAVREVQPEGADRVLPALLVCRDVDRIFVQRLFESLLNRIGMALPAPHFLDIDPVAKSTNGLEARIVCNFSAIQRNQSHIVRSKPILAALSKRLLIHEGQKELKFSRLALLTDVGVYNTKCFDQRRKTE